MLDVSHHGSGDATLERLLARRVPDPAGRFRERGMLLDVWTLDAGTTEFFGRAADLVVTLEDHVLTGGYGSTVLELFSEKQVATPVTRIGWPDKFIEHATTVDYLREKHGLTVANLLAQVNAHFAAAPAAIKLIGVA